MSDHNTVLYTKIVLRKEVEAATLIKAEVKLEIDSAYTIGKSVAVLKDGMIVGHLERRTTCVVWRFLRSGSKLAANIYKDVRGYKNEAWFSIISHTMELGVKIQFCEMSREDSKLLVAHFTKRRLFSFSGVTAYQCPESLKPLVSPVKDENAVSSLLFLSVE